MKNNNERKFSPPLRNKVNIAFRKCTLLSALPSLHIGGLLLRCNNEVAERNVFA